jgi:hypothetical protein
MKRNVSVFAAFLCLLFSSCSVHAGNGSDDQGGTQSLSYNLTENGCQTQEHDFSSQTDYCNGLESDSLNNYCALDLRKSLYQTDCGSNFQES